MEVLLRMHFHVKKIYMGLSPTHLSPEIAKYFGGDTANKSYLLRIKVSVLIYIPFFYNMQTYTYLVKALEECDFVAKSIAIRLRAQLAKRKQIHAY